MPNRTNEAVRGRASHHPFHLPSAGCHTGTNGEWGYCTPVHPWYHDDGLAEEGEMYTGAGVCPGAGVTTLETYDYGPVPDFVRGEWGSSPYYYSSY